MIELGRGDPLLLLHGGIECGGAMWAPVLTKLAEQHRVIVPDVPGLGESAPVDRLDVDAFGRWLASLGDQLGVDQPTVVAHSLIGSLTARMASKGIGPSLRALVLYGAPAVGPYRMPMYLRYVAIRFALRPTAPNAERFDRFALLDLDDTRRRDPGWFDAFTEYTRARATTPFGQADHAPADQPRRPSPCPRRSSRRSRVPTALLWGRHDRMVPLAIAEAAAGGQGWPLHVVEGAAHAPHIEQPDRFVDTLATILAARV